MGIKGLYSMRLRLGHALLCPDLLVLRIPYTTVPLDDDTFLDLTNTLLATH